MSESAKKAEYEMILRPSKLKEEKKLLICSERQALQTPQKADLESYGKMAELVA